jgi:hypothetical protein
MSGYLTLAQAGALYPSPDGQGIRKHTVTRHVTKGARLKDGRRLQLQALRTPEGWVTTQEWLDEFFTALTADRTGNTHKESASKAAARADSLLRASGW